MPRIVHFEIPAEDPDRAIQFYSTVFGWQFNNWGGEPPYWLVTTGPDGEPGINGGLMRRHDPAQPMTNVIGVPSVDEYVQKVTEAGGTVVLPKMPIPGVGWLAYFKDTEGLIMGLHQVDPSAA